MTRFGWLVGVACVVSCWSEDDTIDGFTRAQWTALQQQFAKPALPMTEDSRLGLAAKLFSDPLLSVNGTVSCHSCHDPKDAFIDPRVPNATSLGAKVYTKRNSPSLLNTAYKHMAGRDVYTWSGGYSTAGDVLELAIVKPLATTDQAVAAYIRTRYPMEYVTVGDSDATVITNLEHAFTAFFSTDKFVTQPTAFDKYIAGDMTAMSDAARRGFRVFVGKGTCVECHGGYLFSDLDFHNTGVAQNGDDTGRAKVTMDAADTGKFGTPMLREVAATAPYMHDGSLATLTDVIAFYRRGGDSSIGTKDPRIAPLDLTDADASDLESFLDVLSDHDCDDTTCKVDAGVPADAAPMPDASAPMPDAAGCIPPAMVCATGCFDVTSDPLNCGTCAHVCTNPTPNCVGGMCVH